MSPKKYSSSRHLHVLCPEHSPASYLAYVLQNIPSHGKMSYVPAAIHWAIGSRDSVLEIRTLKTLSELGTFQDARH